MNILYIGIDLSLKVNQIAILDMNGKQLASFSVNNDKDGAELLREKIITMGKRLEITTIKVGMEATNLYWWHLHRFLQTDEKLHQVFTEVVVYTINPMLVKRFHKAYAQLDKTDPIDAMVIADFVRFGKLKLSHLIDEVYEPLKRLTRFRYHMVSQLTASENYFVNHLFLKYSSWQPFSCAYGLTAASVITEYDTEELLQVPLTELAERLMAFSLNTLSDPEKTGKLLKQVINASYQLEKKFQEPVDIVLTNTYENIKYFTKQIQAIDTVIEREFRKYPNTLMSIPGIGLVYAAGITAEIGDVSSRFSNQNQVAKYAGLAWTRKQSGESESEETPQKHGNTHLSHYLVEAANSLRIHNDLYKTYYEKKVEEVPKHQHKRALVLTARKLVRLCSAMLREQRLYQPDGRRKE